MAILSLKTERYEGPLDLLLALIAKNKIDIFDIPISEIAEQYMAYINDMRVLNMEVTGEFIAMASELMLIKSRMLLPRGEDEEDPRRPLVDAILEHKRAALAAEFLKRQGDLYFDRFTKEPEPGDGIYSRPHAADLLREAFFRMAERRALAPDPSGELLFTKISTERYFTVEEKIGELTTLMCIRGECGFDSLFEGARGRGELVAVFLALLELISRGDADLREQNGEIILYLTGQEALI